jgi:hypothetical protein
VDNEISTDFAKQSMVFVDQFNKEMSRKNNFLLLRLHKKNGTTRYCGKNIISHNAYFLGNQLISLSVLAKIMEFSRSSPGYPQILWTKRFMNGPHFAHLAICCFFIF